MTTLCMKKVNNVVLQCIKCYGGFFSCKMMDLPVINRRLLPEACVNLWVESVGADGAPQSYRPCSVNPDLAGM